MAAPKIFISYRREDCAGHAGRLCDRLDQVFGSESVFRDVEDIAAGDDFVDTLHAQVDQCEVLLALIGTRWLGATDAEGRRRLDNVNDWVRREIARGLDRQIRVIPVLLQGAKLPGAADLPDELEPLLRRQAFELRDTQFERDADLLVSLLAPGHRRLHRYRLAIAALLLALAGVGGYAWKAQRDRVQIEQQRQAEQAAHAQSPEAALEWLRANGYDRSMDVLMAEIEKGNHLAVQRLLQSGLDPNTRGYDAPYPLQLAASIGEPRTVELLLAAGASTEHALDSAISYEQGAIIELLLARKLPSKEIQSALDNAAQRNRIDLLERLVALGASVAADNGDALQTAIANGHMATLDWLLQHGASLDAATQADHWTPLHQAVSRSTGADAPALAEAMALRLLDAGQDPNASAAGSGRLYTTPLMVAIHARNAGAALRLLERKADPMVRASDRAELTALHLAVEKELPEVVSALLERGAELDARDRYGRTALMLAARSGAPASAAVLIARTPDLEARDESDRSALMYAATAPNPALTDALLKAGALVDARTREHQTALMLLAASRPFQGDSDPTRNAEAVARRLIEGGASRTAQDVQGRNALALARSQQSLSLVRVLEAP